MMEQEISPRNRFVSAILPWLIAVGALAVYMATLNRWVSLHSLLPVARASGWVWQPELGEPLYWLVTYPLHWLPLKAIPLVDHLLSAVCAALVLALLARSVALLPHDRTHEQRQREHSEFSLLSIRTAWLPPVLAVIVCGLQLTFWEHATSATPAMLNLLVFAYVIRCVLEFRIDDSNSETKRGLIREEIVPRLRELHPAAERNLLRLADAEPTALDELLASTAGSRRLDLGAGLTAVREYDRVWLERTPVALDGEVRWGEWRIASKLPGLKVRAWRAGDRLAGRSKKIQDVFVDAKIPRSARESWPLVVRGDDVVAVPGVVEAEGVRVERVAAD